MINYRFFRTVLISTLLLLLGPLAKPHAASALDDRPPIIYAPSSVSAAEGNLVTVDVTASDPDGDPIASLNAYPLPLGATFTRSSDNAQGTLSWTPDYTQAGTYSVTISAQSASRATPVSGVTTYLTGSATVVLNVSNTDRAPYLYALANMTLREGTTADQSITATDPDGDPLTFTKAAGPEFMSVTLASPLSGFAMGNIHLAPNLGDAAGSPYAASVTASDGSLSDTKPFQIAVLNADRAPILDAIADMAVNEGATANRSITATDPDGDPVSFSKAMGPAFLTVTTLTPGGGSAAGNIHLAPNLGDAAGSPYAASVTASDGSLSDTKPFQIVVSPGINLVGNGSFETSTIGWSGLDGGTIQRVAGGFDGAFSLEVRGPATGTTKFSVNDSPNWVKATPAAGTRYRFTAWFRSATARGRIKLRIREYLQKVYQGTYYSPLIMLAPNWQMVTVDVAAANAGSTLDLQVMDTPIVPGEVFEVDDISILDTSGGSIAARAPDLEAVIAPNPFNPDATLAFTTTQPGPIRVRVYDLAGRYLRTLIEEKSLPPGRQVVRFDGRDTAGRQLPSGVYFFRIEADGQVKTGRAVMLK